MSDLNLNLLTSAKQTEFDRCHAGNLADLLKELGYSGDSVALGAVLNEVLRHSMPRVFPSESAVYTGTGATQTIAHGMSKTPSKVLVVPVDIPAGYGFSRGVPVVDDTNIEIDVTSGVQYQVLVFGWE